MSTDPGEPRDIDEYPQSVDGVEAAYFDGEAVLFRARTRTVHHLGAVAGAVWAMSDGLTSRESLADEIAASFGIAAAVASTGVAEALAALRREGLLAGHPTPERVILDSEHLLTATGSIVLDPGVDRAQASRPSRTLALRLGTDPGHVVVVSASSQKLKRQLLALLHHWLEPSVDSDSLPVAFSVVSAGGTHGSERVRAIAHLDFGTTPMVRARASDDIIHGLAFVLGGFHMSCVQADEAWIGLRVFASGRRCVLADVPRPLLLNDPLLAKQGITELPTWAVLLGSSNFISVPPPLSQLNWTVAEVTAPRDVWSRYEVVGLVSRTRDSVAGVVNRLATGSVDPQWFVSLRDLAGDMSVETATDPAGLRRKITGLLEVHQGAESGDGHAQPRLPS